MIFSMTPIIKNPDNIGQESYQSNCVVEVEHLLNPFSFLFSWW